MTSNTLTTEKTSYLPEGLPMPAASPDGLDQRFWDATKQHELMVQRCASCQTFQFGPEWLCHKCHSFDMRWVEVEGRARIYSWTRCWHAVHPALKGAGPYIAVVVELPGAGNVRMLGNLLGPADQDIRIGAPVTAVFEPHDDAKTPYTLVHWKYT